MDFKLLQLWYSLQCKKSYIVFLCKMINQWKWRRIRMKNNMKMFLGRSLCLSFFLSKVQRHWNIWGLWSKTKRASTWQYSYSYISWLMRSTNKTSLFQIVFVKLVPGPLTTFMILKNYFLFICKLFQNSFESCLLPHGQCYLRPTPRHLKML